MGDGDQWPQIREKVLAASTTAALARTAVHLAAALRAAQYPPYG